MQLRTLFDNYLQSLHNRAPAFWGRTGVLPYMEAFMTKALITVTGADATGIIARVATCLAEMNVNILKITQTIMDGYFTMMMVVDLDTSSLDFSQIDNNLDVVRKELNMMIHIQRMDVYEAMHRV